MAIIWGIVGVVVPFIIGIGLGFLGLTPPAFRTSRWLIWIAFAVLTGWTLWWYLFTAADLRTKIYTLIGIGVANVAGLPCTMIFIGHREKLTTIQPVPEQSDESSSIDMVADPGPAPAKIPAILKVAIKLLPVEDSNRKIVAIILRNTGGMDALHLHIEDIHVFQTRIRFSEDIAVLAAGTATKPIRPIVVEFPASKNRDMALAMFEATYKLRGRQTNDAYDYQGVGSFYDAEGSKYEARWIYTFYPFRFKRTELPDEETVADDEEEVSPYLTVSDVGIGKVPS
jgi:hypothetical protein